MKPNLTQLTLTAALLCSIAPWAQAMGRSQQELQQIDQDSQAIQKNQAEINELRASMQLATEATPAIPNDATDSDLKSIIDRQTTEMRMLHDRQEIQANSQTIVEEEQLLQFNSVDPAPAITQNTTEADLVTILSNQQSKISQLQKDQIAIDQGLDAASGVAGDVLQSPNIDPKKFEKDRCRDLHDSIPNPQVAGRNAWTQKCFIPFANHVMDLAHSEAALQDKSLINFAEELTGEVQAYNLDGGKSFDGDRVFYPSFGKINAKDGSLQNPLNIVAPVNGNDPCNQSYSVTQNDSGVQGGPTGQDLFKNGYQLVAMCVSGCYTPEQRLLFKNGYEEIADAVDSQEREIQTLTPDSTRENLNFKTTELVYYTVDAAPSWQSVFDIKTLSGKTLTVTTNHALMTSDGVMKTAQNLKEGESLVQADGSPDPILSIEPRQYFGKVYNVQPKSGDLLENIVVAEGLLTGSVYYQNLGVRDLNRDLFRINLPSDLVQ